MKTFFVLLLISCAWKAGAQISKASLQASGLTCSMCSKAVKTALENVSFIDKVQVDIKNQQYNLSFKENMNVDFDVLDIAVKDAGFSVAALQITAAVNNTKLGKDEHLVIGGQHFHFLNAANQIVDGTITFSLVDKGFVTAKQFKKFSAMTTMSCVQTGRMASCCSPADAAAESRIYHVVI